MQKNDDEEKKQNRNETQNNKWIVFIYINDFTVNTQLQTNRRFKLKTHRFKIRLPHTYNP